MEMENLHKYNGAFIECFQVSEGDLGEALLYQSIPSWDSVGHMQLMATLEDSFDILMETEDIIDFSSYAKGMDILAKYGVELD
jgi:acyl carrier protein